MPKKSVVEFECDRCGRTWHGDEHAGTASVQMTFRDHEGAEALVVYDILCEPCERTVAGAVGILMRELTHRSPRRSGAKKDDEAPEGQDVLAGKPVVTPPPAPPAPQRPAPH